MACPILQDGHNKEGLSSAVSLDNKGIPYHSTKREKISSYSTQRFVREENYYQQSLKKEFLHKPRSVHSHVFFSTL